MTTDRNQEFLGFVEASADLIFRCDRKLQLTYANPAVSRAFGLLAEEIIGDSMSSSVRRASGEAASHPELARFEQRLEAVFGTGDAMELEFTWPTAEGPRTYSLRLSPEADANGVVINVLGHARDITDLNDARRQNLALKLVEETLRESERRFRQVTESINEVFWLTDTTKQQMIYLSPAYEKIWGRTCASVFVAPEN